MADVYHALGLHMHQPLGNLLALHNSEATWEARQILWCYDRPTRMLEGYEDVARLHLSFSGTLLKQFEDSGVRQTFGDTVNVADFLDRYRRSNIEFVGSGLYHPVYPLVPQADWEAQTEWWLGLGRHLLGRESFAGFWPPEMGFCMEMIPLLSRHGYKYVLVDSIYIKPKRKMRWEELRYRPYRARYDGAEIIVVPRDRELSNAQLSGLDPGWFQHEMYERTKHCDFPALVTTWTDGENGGWFRTTKVESGFWGFFYRPILDRFRAGTLRFHAHPHQPIPGEVSAAGRGRGSSRRVEHRAPLGRRLHPMDRLALAEERLGRSAPRERVLLASQTRLRPAPGGARQPGRGPASDHPRVRSPACRPKPVATSTGAAAGSIARLMAWSRPITCWIPP